MKQTQPFLIEFFRYSILQKLANPILLLIPRKLSSRKCCDKVSVNAYSVSYNARTIEAQRFTS
ncbi:hypothetical protein E4413_14785 [Leptospira interrogans]|nr:hypothetical protein C5473_16190 [Leptospira interrogans serovar Weerasinghe]KAA1290086.1 hypothetical protein C4X99_06345 [Leptospira interrogans serovar Geyaweera]QCO34180.1 hypothetical protein E4414_14715 [Leptospira interrogans]QCO42027.1 hypothetical protein E4413_14785 [Leptospira interrogans]